jgi:hypothetical protein
LGYARSIDLEVYWNDLYCNVNASRLFVREFKLVDKKVTAAKRASVQRVQLQHLA